MRQQNSKETEESINNFSEEKEDKGTFSISQKRESKNKFMVKSIQVQSLGKLDDKKG